MDLISLFNSKIFTRIDATNIWCKLGNYFYFILPCLASTYITLASIDRFCASSSNNKLHRLNHLKISYILASVVFFIWGLFSLHIPISYNLVRSTSTSAIQCNPSLEFATVFVIIDGFFFTIFNGIIVPFILIIFGLLIFRNVKLIHRRTVPQQLFIVNRTTTSIVNQPVNGRLTRGNQHLITMLLFQVSFTIILNIPFMVISLYNIYNPAPKDPLSLLFYVIFTFIGRWFWIMIFCKAFYVNTVSSQTFRNILKRRITKLISLFYTVNHQNLPHQFISHHSSSSSNSDSALFTRTRNPPRILN